MSAAARQPFSLATTIRSPCSQRRERSRKSFLVESCCRYARADRTFGRRAGGPARLSHSPRSSASTRCTSLAAWSEPRSNLEQHGRRELLEAFLLLASRENAVLKRILQSPQRSRLHAAGRFARRQLAARHRTAVALVSRRSARSSFGDANHRSPRRRFVPPSIVRKIGPSRRRPCGANLRRIEIIPWIVANLSVLDALPREGAAGRRASGRRCHRTSRNHALEVVAYVLRHGKVVGRRIAACRPGGIRRAAQPMSSPLKLMDDDDSEVRAAAARQLRQRNVPAQSQRLLKLLESDHAGEREAAQAGLIEFSLERFSANFDAMTPGGPRFGRGAGLSRRSPGDRPSSAPSSMLRPAAAASGPWRWPSRCDAIAMLQAANRCAAQGRRSVPPDRSHPHPGPARQPAHATDPSRCPARCPSARAAGRRSGAWRDLTTKTTATSAAIDRSSSRETVLLSRCIQSRHGSALARYDRFPSRCCPVTSHFTWLLLLAQSAAKAPKPGDWSFGWSAWPLSPCVAHRHLVVWLIPAAARHRKGKNSHSPWCLFTELCTSHGLNRRERQLLDSPRPAIQPRASLRPVHRVGLVGARPPRPRLAPLPPRARKAPQAPIRRSLIISCRRLPRPSTGSSSRPIAPNTPRTPESSRPARSKNPSRRPPAAARPPA